MTKFPENTLHDITFPAENVQLQGLLFIPKLAKGIVLFAHGSGSSRFSKRNQYVAKMLQDANIATFLFDLFTPEEEEFDAINASLRFNIPFLASRLLAATDWIEKNSSEKFSIGYFGASTGGGAGIAAAAMNKKIKAVVSRGGRPDLAGNALSEVQAPTLLIVGGDDTIVIDLNQNAYEKMHCVKKLEIVPGATHLFEEPGTLDEVAKLARDWFIKYLN